MIEDYVSGRAVSRFYKLRVGRDLSPREIAEAARSGEPSAAAAWEEFGVHVGTALSWIVNLVDPDVVLLGGSLATQMDLFRKGMEDALFPHISPLPRAHCRFVPAELGDKAPLLGAAALALGQASV
jgi:glucokinase